MGKHTIDVREFIEDSSYCDKYVHHLNECCDLYFESILLFTFQLNSNIVEWKVPNYDISHSVIKREIKEAYDLLSNGYDINLVPYPITLCNIMLQINCDVFMLLSNGNESYYCYILNRIHFTVDPIVENVMLFTTHAKSVVIDGGIDDDDIIDNDINCIIAYLK
jgi:hypothetical protein